MPAASGALSVPASSAARREVAGTREIVPFSPEDFCVFNTLAVPQLSGQLLERGPPVVRQVLDDQLCRHPADEGVHGTAVDELAAK